MAEVDVSSLGSDLMAFFSPAALPKNGDGHLEPVSLGEFLKRPGSVPPHIALAAAEKLAEQGFMTAVGQRPGPPILNACYVAAGSASGGPDVYDFLVAGFPEVRRRLADAVLHLEVSKPDGTVDSGTGFLIAETLAVTARHCVEGVDFEIQHPTDSGAVIIEQAGDPQLAQADFALLPVAPGHGLPSFKVGRPQTLARVMAMGYPRLEGLHPTLVTSTGEVAGAADGYLDDNSYWLTTCALTGGSSGGPVVNERGQVVGVVSALPADGPSVRSAPFGLVVSPVDGFSSLASPADGVSNQCQTNQVRQVGLSADGAELQT